MNLNKIMMAQINRIAAGSNGNSARAVRVPESQQPKQKDIDILTRNINAQINANETMVANSMPYAEKVALR